MSKTQQVIVAMIEYRPTCKDCGEHLHGDGYKVVMHCPNIEELRYEEVVAYAEPDAGPFYCGWSEEEEQQ